MKFGKVDNPGAVDFTLPEDHPGTAVALSKYPADGELKVYVGCAKWNRQDLKNFYPRGTKDELEYYASQFNAVEMNATHYRNFPAEQIEAWREKVPVEFRFFPKVYQRISHHKWLSDVQQATEEYLNSVLQFKENMGTIFLQLRDNFAPKFFDRVQAFIEYWPEGVPLALELRHPEWFSNEALADEWQALLEENNVANVIVDTAGRRDMAHMRLTNNEVFVRYVGANHPSDYTRLDPWVQRLKKWKGQGLRNIHFFLHQHEEKASPLLAAYFVRKANEVLGCNLHVPETTVDGQQRLF